MTPHKRNPDDTGPNKAHDFSVRVNGFWLEADGRVATNMPERDAWKVFLANRLNGRVEMLRGPVVVARIGAKA